MPGKEISIECGRLWRDYVKAVKHIFGGDVLLREIGLEDLLPIRRLHQHINAGCEACARREREKTREIVASLEKG